MIRLRRLRSGVLALVRLRRERATHRKLYCPVGCPCGNAGIDILRPRQ